MPGAGKKQINPITYLQLHLIARRNTNNLRYTDDTTFMAESEEALRSLFMRMKKESTKKLA